MFARVVLLGFFCVFARVRGVLMRDLGVMSGLFMITGFVVLRCLVVMLRRVLMMICCLAVMLSSLVGHMSISLDPGLAYRNSIQPRRNIRMKVARQISVQQRRHTRKHIALRILRLHHRCYCSIMKSPTELDVDLSRIVVVESSEGETVVEQYAPIGHIQSGQRELVVLTKIFPKGNVEGRVPG